MTFEQCLELTDEKWLTLDEEKKVEVLQTIENHVAYESGRLSCPVLGKFLYTGNDGVVLGTYDPKNQVIYINSSQFDAESKYGKDSESLIIACLHEGRHSYQHQVIDGLAVCDDNNAVEEWRVNLANGNYISFRENPRAYYNQPVEVDARTFSEERYQSLVEERNLLIEEKAEINTQKDVFEHQMGSDEICFTGDTTTVNYDNQETKDSLSMDQTISIS